MNPTLALIARHRTIRTYTDEPISDETIRQVVGAAQQAATSSNVQAHCLIRVRDQAKREALIPLTGGQERVANGAAFFMICGDQRRHRLAARHHGHDYDSRLEGFVLAVVDASLFAQNLVLGFESLGLGTCYIGGLRNDLNAVQELFHFPEGIVPLYGLCVGSPAEDPDLKPRLPLDAVLFDDAYPDDDTMLAHLEAYDETCKAYYEARIGKPRAWSEPMARKFSTAARAYLATFYRAQGVNLD